MTEMISFGAGVNSVAMTIMLVNSGWRGPIAFGDTEGEKPGFYWHAEYMIVGLSLAIGLIVGGYLLFLWGWKEQHQVYEMMPQARALLKILGPDVKKLVWASVRASGAEPTGDTEALVEELRQDIRGEIAEALRAQYDHQARPTHWVESQASVEEKRRAKFRLDAAGLVILGLMEGHLSRNQLIEERDPSAYIVLPSGLPLNRRTYTGIIHALNDWQGHDDIISVSRAGTEVNYTVDITAIFAALTEINIPDDLQEMY